MNAPGVEQWGSGSWLGRVGGVAYGAFTYLVFLVVFGYVAGFLIGWAVPKAIDDGVVWNPGAAVAVDVSLWVLFGVQHSLMARPWFKRAWAQVVPPALERSTYVLLSSAALALLMWLWRPLPQLVWSLGDGWPRTAVAGTYVAGLVLVVASTCLIDHLDMFGLKQVLARFRSTAYRGVPFRTPGLYRLVRHPLYVGFLVVFWVTPDMSVGHLMFASLTTVYILVAVRFEEHDLRASLGDDYVDYSRRIRRFIPVPKRYVRSTIGGDRTTTPEPMSHVIGRR